MEEEKIKTIQSFEPLSSINHNFFTSLIFLTTPLPFPHNHIRSWIHNEPKLYRKYINNSKRNQHVNSWLGNRNISSTWS